MNKKTLVETFDALHDKVLKYSPTAPHKKGSASLLEITKDYLESGQFVRKSVMGGTESLAIADATTVHGMVGAALENYLDNLHIPRNSEARTSAADAAALFLAKESRYDSSSKLQSHFASSNLNSTSNTLSSAYAPSVRNLVTPTQTILGVEAFGASVNNVISDLAKGLAINVSQSDTAILNKIMHRVSTPQPYVSFDQVYAEVYDMLESNDKSAQVRYHGSHRKPFVKLYTNPRPVSNELQPLVPLQANAQNGEVYKDGFLNAGARANLFDLSMDANKLGGAHYNYTDLVSENVKLDKVIVKLKTNGSVTWAQNKEEEIVIDVSQARGALLSQVLNANDSGVRFTVSQTTHLLDNTTKKSDGSPSEILAKCTATDKIKLTLDSAATINLKTADTTTFSSPAQSPYSTTGGDPVADVKDTLAPNLTVTVVAMSLQAFSSEENLRKSNLAIRTNSANFHFEIACARNIMVDYSFSQTGQEDGALNCANEAAALGVDHRGIYVITEQLKYTYLQNRDLKLNGEFQDVNDRINNNCVAGMIVNPTAQLGVIDCSEIDTIRSSDLTGDIRGWFESKLISIFAQFYQDSLYRLKLKEKPRFRVLTSPLLLATLFQMPHIHNHLQALSEEQIASDGVDYRRVLPDGTILEIVTANYEYLRNAIIMIPMTTDSDNILSFGGNYDCGTFVATYDPVDNNAAWRRIFTNARSQVIPTNPSGVYLTVTNLDTVLELDDTVGFESNDLPDASDLVSTGH